MKIGVIVDNELNNDKRVTREISILRDAGHEIYVLCFGFRNEYPVPLEGIRVTRIKISKRVKNISFFFQNTLPVYEWLWKSEISRFIRNCHPDVIHVHDLNMSKAGRNGIKKSGVNIPMILDLHENYPFAVSTYNWTKGILRSLLSRPGRWLKKEFEYMMFADGLIVLSNEFRDILRQTYPELEKKKFIAFPNVPDLASISPGKINYPSLPFNKDAFVIFYFGVAAERRGIFDVLEVFESLAIENHPAVLMVIGSIDKKDKERFFKLINGPLLRERIYYIPWIDIEELPGYLSKSGAGIAPFKKNPQHESGIANKVFDYMSGRKPVIASDCKPQKNLIEKYNCGIVYTTNDQMKEAIKRLSSDPDLCIKMGENGFNAIVNEYNTGKTKEILLKFYDEIK